MRKLKTNLVIEPIAQTEDTIIIKVFNRFENDTIIPRNGIEVSDFYTRETNVKTTIITSVIEPRNGVYELSVQKFASYFPVNLDKGEYVDINIEINEYKSNTIRFEQK